MKAGLYTHFVYLAETQPERIAIELCDKDGVVVESISYRELPKKLEEVASGLDAQGLQVGDRIALSLSSSFDHVVMSLAAWCAGIITVPLDNKRDTKEASFFKIRTSHSVLVIREMISDQRHFSKWLSDISRVAMILFTSGTTGSPKGVELTLNNLCINAKSIGEWLRLSGNDVFLVVLPMHHINSTTFSLAVLLAGGKLVLTPGYSSSRFWHQIARSGATVTSVVPSILFDQLARKSEFENVKSGIQLSRVQVGSAPVVAHTVLEFIRSFGIPLYQGYGQTETSLRVTGVPLDLPASIYNSLLEENSIGTPMPWAQVEVMNKDGVFVSENQEGELVVSGPAVMRGYIGGEDAFRGDFFLTGDLGFFRIINGRRYFFLTGREKEIIIKGGINISPVAVENALKKVSSQIDQVYVVGVKDSRYGEVPAAAVCWKPKVDHTVAMRILKGALFLGSKDVPAYDAPQYFRSFKIKDLPSTSTGKVQRVILKKQFSDKDSLEPLENILENARYKFVFVDEHSNLAKESQRLYNHCWQPLVANSVLYGKYLREHKTIAAIDSDGTLAGQISFSYKEKVLTCVSICSASYIPKPIPKTKNSVTYEEVRSYILDGNDAVINFHIKLGAEFIDVIPNGRPDDKRALGYIARLRYKVPARVGFDENDRISKQLISIVLLLAKDQGVSYVEVLSRPGGLAAHIANIAQTHNTKDI